MKRIVSGVQPTGNFHLGNYLGALKNWVSVQKDTACYFCVVDLHALTIPQDPKLLKQSVYNMVATYIAAGIDPENATIFIQSHIPGHAELAWLLGCLTPLGWLNRMTQFKEKSAKVKDMANLGLYAYPVLMAADILLYHATHVPVGADQKQHLELTRDIAAVFNRHYATAFFSLPEPMILGPATRVMSLRDGASKMSKSDPQELSRIHLTDTPDQIALKIRKAKTDSLPLPATPEELEGRPEALNLVNVYAALQNMTVSQVCANHAGTSFSSFKPVLTDCIVETLRPIQQRFTHLIQNQDYLQQILEKGALKANALASQTLRDVRTLMGLINL